MKCDVQAPKRKRGGEGCTAPQTESSDIKQYNNNQVHA